MDAGADAILASGRHADTRSHGRATDGAVTLESTRPARPDGQTPALASTSAPPGDALALAARIVGLAVLAVVAIWLLVMLRSIVLEVLFAVILASGLEPLVERLLRAGVPKAISVLLIYLGFILTLVLFGALVIPPVVDQLNELVAHAPVYADRLTQWLAQLREQFPFLPPIDQQFVEELRAFGGQLGAVASQALVVARFALGIASGLLSSFLLLLITLYLVVDGPHVRDYVLSFVSRERRARLRDVTDRMGERMGGWLLGQVVLSASVGTVTFVGLTLLGIPGATLLALVAAVGEVIPMVGPVVSAVPAVLVALSISPLWAVFTVVLYIVVQQLENNLLVPQIMQRAVQLHPLAVVLSLLVGSELLGIAGALIAVPVAAAISVGLNELRDRAEEPAMTVPTAVSSASPESPP